VAGFRTGAGRCSPEISVGRIMNVRPNGRTSTLILRTRFDRRRVEIARPSLYRHRRAFEVLVLEQRMSRRLRLSSTSGAANRLSLIETTAGTKTGCHLRGAGSPTGCRVPGAEVMEASPRDPDPGRPAT
jgi:hypothetical protein